MVTLFYKVRLSCDNSLKLPLSIRKFSDRTFCPHSRNRTTSLNEDVILPAAPWTLYHERVKVELNVGSRGTCKTERFLSTELSILLNFENLKTDQLRIENASDRASEILSLVKMINQNGQSFWSVNIRWWEERLMCIQDQRLCCSPSFME